jgi:hypothetical protein
MAPDEFCFFSLPAAFLMAVVTELWLQVSWSSLVLDLINFVFILDLVHGVSEIFSWLKCQCLYYHGLLL